MDVHLDALGYVGGWAQKALKSDRDFDHFDIGTTVPGLVAASTSKRLEAAGMFRVVWITDGKEVGDV